MKKILLLITAMLAMGQMNATSANDAAASDNALPQVATEAQDGDNDNESAYQHPFANNDESTKHWSVTTSGFYVGMGVKHSWETINNSFEIGLLNFAAVNYNSLHGQNISLGVGIHHRSYSIKRPNMLVRDAGNIVVVDEYPTINVDQIKKRSSNLNMWTIQFPLMFSQRIVKKLNVTVAGIMNWNAYSRVDNHYEMDNVVHDTKFKKLKQQKIGFDVMGALSWNKFGLYCRYSPGKFFKDGYGPEIKNTWTVGIAMGL